MKKKITILNVKKLKQIRFHSGIITTELHYILIFIYIEYLSMIIIDQIRHKNEEDLSE